MNSPVNGTQPAATMVELNFFFVIFQLDELFLHTYPASFPDLGNCVTERLQPGHGVGY